MRRRLFFLGLFALCLPLSGCGSGSTQECEKNSDCDPYDICVDGKCTRLPCLGGCPEGTYCDKERNQCAACLIDEFCGNGCVDCTAQVTNRICVDGDCGCRSEADCAAGQQCLDNRCTGCIPDCHEKCGGADDGCEGTCDRACPSGMWCSDQACVTCDTDDHCGTECLDCTAVADVECGGSCVSGTCDFPETVACGFCRTCDGKGGCVDVVSGEDPFDDCQGAPPCGMVCDGGGGCVYPDESVQCGLACQSCDGAGACVPDCGADECRQNVWECQCHPVETELTCGSVAGGSLLDLERTTDLFDEYGVDCGWVGNPLDGREMTFPFGFSGAPSPRLVTVTFSAVCNEAEVIGMAIDGSEPCDPDRCIVQQHGGFY